MREELSDVQNEAPVFVRLLPEEISLPENTNVRPWESKQEASEQDIKELNDLMQSIVEEGQIQPVRVAYMLEVKNGEPHYKLIAGRRRRQAVMMYNLSLPDGAEPLKLDATVEEVVEGEKVGKTLARQFRRAAHENILRKNLSPMDFALNISEVRSKFKWDGADKTKEVAEFFKVSPATISQHEKLLTLPVEVQGKIASGELSKDDAFRLSAIAEKAGVEKAVEAMKKGVEAGEQVETAAEMEAHVEVVTGVPGKKKKVVKATAKKKAAAQSKSIKKAVREAGVKSTRNKAEILEFFEGLRGPAYGYPDGAVWQFVDRLMEFAAGRVGERALQTAFDKLAEKAAKGSAASLPKPEAEVKKTAIKKAAHKK